MKIQRILSILLAIIMMLGMFAFAEDAVPVAVEAVPAEIVEATEPAPIEEPEAEPTEEPAVEPTEAPEVPEVETTEEPVVEPTEEPEVPEVEPTEEPTEAPTEEPLTACPTCGVLASRDPLFETNHKACDACGLRNCDPAHARKAHTACSGCGLRKCAEDFVTEEHMKCAGCREMLCASEIEHISCPGCHRYSCKEIDQYDTYNHTLNDYGRYPCLDYPEEPEPEVTPEPTPTPKPVPTPTPDTVINDQFELKTDLEKGGTYKLGQSFTLTTEIPELTVDKAFNLDLNGYSLDFGGRSLVPSGLLKISGNGQIAKDIFDPSNYIADGHLCALSEDGSVYLIRKGNAIDDNKVAAAVSDTELAKALQDGATTILLGEGTFDIPNDAQRKTLKFIGNDKNTTIEVKNEAGGQDSGCDYGGDGSDITFQSLIIDTRNNNGWKPGYARMSGTYINCTFEGTYYLMKGPDSFTNCTFNIGGDQYNIWTWGAGFISFSGCTFNSDGKAILLYNEHGTASLKLSGCTFNDKGGLSDKKAAIEIGDDGGSKFTVTVTNTKVNGYEINDKGINTGSTLWGNKNSMAPANLTVTVDGTEVYGPNA